jgi:hypothetical protein
MEKPKSEQLSFRSWYETQTYIIYGGRANHLIITFDTVDEVFLNEIRIYGINR